MEFFKLTIIWWLCLDRVLGYYMEGVSRSYAMYPSWQPCMNGSVELEFKTSQPNGLIMYTDDGGLLDFFELKLLRGSMILIFRLGTEKMRFPQSERFLNDSLWHHVSLKRSGRNVTLTVDTIPYTREYHSRDQEFGVQDANSPLFIGGIPMDYLNRKDELTQKSVFQEPHFQGFIRNLFVSDCGKPKRRPRLLKSSDILNDHLDKCTNPVTDPCLHGGLCLTTDQGAQCNCTFTQFEGEFCEKESSKSEVTFYGSQYFYYDLSARDDIYSTTNDRVDFYFRTEQQSGFLFYTGERSDYIMLALRGGWVVGLINLGDGDTHLEINPPGYRFDDNQWHHVVLTRHSRRVQLSVDGIHVTETNIVGFYTILDNKVVYTGGHQDVQTVGQEIGVLNNFRGCMRKVKYTAGDVELDLTKMAADQEEYMQIIGDVTFNKCQEIVQSHPITFTTPESFIRLPHWEVGRLGGIMTFTFQTNEPNGLIMYNSGKKNSDFFAFELWDGFLWLIVDLGSGAIKERVTQNKVNDGVQHQVILEHKANSGYIMLDGQRMEYIVSGQSNYLNLDGELYIGGIDDAKRPLPKDLSAAILGYGFVGCFQDLTLNREKVDLLTVARKNLKSGISDTCRVMEPQCLGQPCYNGGICKEGWNRYICDCTKTPYTGSSCQTPAATLEFNGAQYMKVTLAEESLSEAEDIYIRFRTTRNDGLIFVTSSDWSSDTIELYLEGGILRLDFRINNQKKQFQQGEMSGGRKQLLSDGNWHTVRIVRRQSQISFYLDTNSHQASVVTLRKIRHMHVKYIVLGSPGPMLADQISRNPQSMNLRSMNSGRMSHDINAMGRQTGFTGSMQQFIFNGNHYFEIAKRNKSNQLIDLTARFESEEPIFRDAVTFKSNDSYVILKQLNARLTFSIYFKLKTIEPDGLLFFNGGQGQDFIALELQSGYLHFIYNMGDGAERIVVNTINPLNDNQWHSVMIQRPSQQRITLRVDTLNPSVADLSSSEKIHLNLEGNLYVGGVTRTMYKSLPQKVSSRHGYRGCMASVDFNGNKPNLVMNSESLNGVVKNCNGKSSGGMDSCKSNPCHNFGACISQWSSYTCDCDMTSYTGPTCRQASTYATFGPGKGLITYRIPQNKVKDTNDDYLAFGFRAQKGEQGKVILFRVESSTRVDYLEVQLVNGAVFMVYNLGASDHPVGNLILNGYADGNYHVIRVERNKANASLTVDNDRPTVKAPDNDSMKVFNRQAYIFVGGNNKSDDSAIPFKGTISGLVFNHIPVLDLASKGDPYITVTGDVLVTSASKQQMQSTEGLQKVKVLRKRGIRNRNGGPNFDVTHSNNQIKSSNVLSAPHSNIMTHSQGNTAHHSRTSTHSQRYNNNGLIDDRAGYRITSKVDSAFSSEDEDDDVSELSRDYDVISGERSGSGSGQDEVIRPSGKVNQAEVPSVVIDSMNIHWNRELRRGPTMKSNYKRTKEILNHQVFIGEIKSYKKNSNLIRPLGGRFPKDRGKISISERGIRTQLLQHSTTDYTTPRQGVTDEIIIPITAGSGEGEINCPTDDEDDCIPTEHDDGIITATVTIIRKPTTTTTVKATKSTQYDLCQNNKGQKCESHLGTDGTANKSVNIVNEKTTLPDSTFSKNPDYSKSDAPTKPNLALIIGIVAGVLIALIILVIALYKFRSRDEGTYKVDESQNFPHLEGKKQPSNGALLGNHNSSKSGKKKDVTEWYV